MNQEYILEMKEITMQFPGVKALDCVSLQVKKGEVLGLIGENGAGKSTLMKVLLGINHPTAGSIVFNGKPFAPKSPNDALHSGISMIHQEISLIPEMTVAENIWLGREKRFQRYHIIDGKKRAEETKKFLELLDLDIDPDKHVSELPVAQMQLVELARAVSYDADVIIMDEPTSALTDVETQKLFRIVRQVSEKGTAVIFISHKLEELLEICDRITVLRDGQYVDTKATTDLSKNQLINLMVGREITDMYPKEQTQIGKEIFSCKGISRRGSFQDVSFSVHEGEILGFCGLMGAQRTEIVQAIFGLEPPERGEMYLNGEKISNKNPKAAIHRHFALVTEDRLRRGALHTLPIRDNMSLAYLEKVCCAGFVDKKAEARDCKKMVDSMNIKMRNLTQPIGSLSGGNQQKVIIGRWLLTQPQVFILDEPTRGIDVGAKAEIYRLIGKMAKSGKAIMMVSSELPELMGICDRILVVREGRLVADVPRSQFSQDLLMSYAFGVNERSVAKNA